MMPIKFHDPELQMIGDHIRKLHHSSCRPRKLTLLNYGFFAFLFVGRDSCLAS